MDVSMQLVNFRYCKTCENRGLSDADDPCNSCLEVGGREGTSKPLNYKQKKMEKSEPVRFDPEQPFDPNEGLEDL